MIHSNNETPHEMFSVVGSYHPDPITYVKHNCPQDIYEKQRDREIM